MLTLSAFVFENGEPISYQGHRSRIGVLFMDLLNLNQTETGSISQASSAGLIALIAGVMLNINNFFHQYLIYDSKNSYKLAKIIFSMVTSDSEI